MTLSFTRQFLRAGATALILSTVTSVSMFVSADAVYAERGGNGKSGGNRGNSDRSSSRSDNGNANRSSNGNANRSNNGNANRSVVQEVTTGTGNNGRGVLARELRGLNAAHANQNALENASPNSMPGKLYIYQQEQPELRANEAEAIAELERLTALTAAEIADEFPDGDYAAALAAVSPDAAEIARLDGLDAATIATDYPDGDYAAALAAAVDNETELARLQGLDAFGIVAEFPNDDYVAALEAAAGDPAALELLQGLDAAAIAAAYPDDVYAVSITDAGDAYADSQQAVINSLLALSGDRPLSDAALEELDSLLGLLE
jgi:hypothetical protein